MVFCNNANAALRRDAWEAYRFNEELTGCEDMYLARMLVEGGNKIGYVADAPVFHIHDESWRQIKIRYEREAIALRKILPSIRITRFDMLKYIVVGVVKDIRAAIRQKVLYEEAFGILLFRVCQYYGSYAGNRASSQLSRKMKHKYFYPRISDMDVLD